MKCFLIKFNKYSSLFCPIEKEELLDFLIEKQPSASVIPVIYQGLNLKFLLSDMVLSVLFKIFLFLLYSKKFNI